MDIFVGGRGGNTLWLCLMRSIFSEGPRSQQLSLQTKGYVMVMIKKFLGLGAQLNDSLPGVRSLNQTTVAQCLASIFTTTEMEELESLRRQFQAESLKAKISSHGVGINPPFKSTEKKREKEKKGAEKGARC